MIPGEMQPDTEVTEERRDGPSGPVRVVVCTAHREPAILEPLEDPDRFVPAPEKPSHVRKLRRRRAVHSFPAVVDRREARLYLKLYRVRGVKDVLEELLLGKRAGRSFRAALEARRRGIEVPVHFGWSAPARPERWPARSALLTLGVPHNRDARSTLDTELAHDAPARRRFLGDVGRFLGDAHRRGIVHGDLKLGNVFVLSLTPVRLTLLDLDRARFVDPAADHVPLRQVLDLRALLRSIRRRPIGERRLLLAGWLRARRPGRAVRRAVLRRLALLGAW